MLAPISFEEPARVRCKARSGARGVLTATGLPAPGDAQHKKHNTDAKKGGIRRTPPKGGRYRGYQEQNAGQNQPACSNISPSHTHPRITVVLRFT
ncbi:MAG: hypothetical protein HY652_13400 [Acidobacteria bacterium]|nr:hypothetical protein [Acidobacteriota bacterium]